VRVWKRESEITDESTDDRLDLTGKPKGREEG
jgi:hypothetical protein